MPWSPSQHRLFCAKCKNGKGPADMCRMCKEGIKDDTEGEAMNRHVKEKAEQRRKHNK